MPPPIRYPLLWMIGALLIGLGAWLGAPMIRQVRATIHERLRPFTEGPPIPSSDTPQVVAGPIIRKGLLLRDHVAVTTLPDGPLAETVRLRLFVDVYDVWPLKGAPAYDRIGNRRPMGWIKAADLLPWNTRLVVRPTSEATTLPVLEWSADRVEVAVWPPDQPWAESYQRRTLRAAELPAERWGVWLSRTELLALLQQTLTPASDRPPALLRMRAVIGRLLDNRPLGTDADLAAARAALPPVVFAESSTPSAAAERLARINEHWSPEASWGGSAFQFVPLTDLP